MGHHAQRGALASSSAAAFLGAPGGTLRHSGAQDADQFGRVLSITQLRAHRGRPRSGHGRRRRTHAGVAHSVHARHDRRRDFGAVDLALTFTSIVFALGEDPSDRTTVAGAVRCIPGALKILHLYPIAFVTDGTSLLVLSIVNVVCDFAAAVLSAVATGINWPPFPSSAAGDEPAARAPGAARPRLTGVRLAGLPAGSPA